MNFKRTTFRFAPIIAILCALPAGNSAQDPDRMKGTLAEPDDAAEVRQQIATIEKLLPQLPDRGAALYLLAIYKHHLGETLETLRLLKECVALREGFDPSGSLSLRVLKGTKEFDDLVAGVHRDFPAVSDSRLAFLSEERDLVPEGLAYDARQDIFFMSSLNRRKIVKFNSEGRISDFVPPLRDHLLPILGIRLDPSDSTVWATSWSEDTGRSELLHFDSSGKLLERFSPAAAEKHGFNDLVLRNSGEILLTDSVTNQVLRFDRSAHSFSAVPVLRPLSAPNGITLAEDDRQLFIADDLGVVRVDLETGASEGVNPGARNTLAGIDGLYWHKGSLVAVQNGIGSPRIVLFRLSKDGSRVTQTTVLENRTGFTASPTTGAIHGNDFYYISNGQGDNLNGDKIMDVTRLAAVRIAVVHIP